MTREWKPGDVALVRIGQQSIWARAMLSADGSEWICSWAGGGHTHPINHRDLDVRPLVAIDPEDREDVERLADEIHHAHVGHRYGNCYPDEYDEVQAALRSLTADPKPPKPEEPTGLGAVVEDAEAKQWIRLHTHQGDCNDWYPVRGAGYDEPEIRSRENGGMRRSWSELDVVRVLSEGVRS